MLILAALLATASPLTPRDLVEVVDLSGLAVSPDGQWVIVRVERPSVARNRVELSWAILPTDGSGTARVVADGGIALSNGAGVLENEQPIWLLDGSGFLVRARIAGTAGVWRVPRSGAAAVRLTDPAVDVTRFVLDPGGRSVTATLAPSTALAAGIEQALKDHGVRLEGRIDLSIGAVGGFDAGDGARSVRMTGDWFDRTTLLASVQTVSIDLSGQLATRQALAADAQRAAPMTRESVCRLLDCSHRAVASIAQVPGRDAWIATLTDRAIDQHLFLIERGRARQLGRKKGLLSGSRSESAPCALTSQAAICVAASAGEPPRLVRVDLADGRVSGLYAPNRALAARLAGQVERLTWQDKQRTFHGVLIRPRGARTVRRPLVVQYYRCSGFLRGGVGDELPYQLLVDRGIASLCINRAPAGSKQDSLDDYRVAQSAITTIVDRLAAAGVVDSRLVGMQGLSFGSEVTMWMVRQSRLVRAASIASGQIEPAFYWYGALPPRDLVGRVREVYGLGAPDETPARWRLLSPARDTANIAAPLLMQLPEAEARWSIELIARLAQAGHPVEAYVFPDAAHVKFLPRQKEAAYARNLSWFSHWLNPASLGRSNGDAFAEWRATQSLTTIGQ
ncbi:MAG: Atxe2 family lasso peptide isopeptidase [Pseudomonadota bacterium]